MELDRRLFAKVAVAATAFNSARILGANDRIRCATIGTGGRGTYLTKQFVAQDVEVAAVCDVYEPNVQQGLKEASPGAKATRTIVACSKTNRLTPSLSPRRTIGTRRCSSTRFRRARTYTWKSLSRTAWTRASGCSSPARQQAYRPDRDAAAQLRALPGSQAHHGFRRHGTGTAGERLVGQLLGRAQRFQAGRQTELGAVPGLRAQAAARRLPLFQLAALLRLLGRNPHRADGAHRRRRAMDDELGLSHGCDLRGRPGQHTRERRFPRLAA